MSTTFFFFFLRKDLYTAKIGLEVTTSEVQLDPSASAFLELDFRNALSHSTLKHILNTTAPKPIDTEKQG